MLKPTNVKLPDFRRLAIGVLVSDPGGRGAQGPRAKHAVNLGGRGHREESERMRKRRGLDELAAGDQLDTRTNHMYFKGLVLLENKSILACEDRFNVGSTLTGRLQEDSHVPQHVYERNFLKVFF